MSLESFHIYLFIKCFQCFFIYYYLSVVDCYLNKQEKINIFDHPNKLNSKFNYCFQITKKKKQQQQRFNYKY